MRLLAALVLATATGVAAFAAAPLDFSPADVYIAPENMIVLRMVRPDGKIREFERVISKGGMLRSVGGWTGVESKKSITVESPADANNPERYSFKRGRLVSYVGSGVATNIPYAAERSRLPEERSPLIASAAPPPDAKEASAISKATMAREYKQKWGRSGRLCFPYGNPNQAAAFWAEIAIGLFALAVAFRRRMSVRAAVAAAAAVALACVMWAGSRGAVLSLCAALAVFALTRRDVVVRLVRNKWFWIAVAVAVAAIVAWIVWKDPKFLTRGMGTGGNKGWSNRVRMEMWMAAPRMMLDAASGWGSVFEVGRAYMDWYQPLSEVSLPGSLINDHLTAIVGFSWTLRAAYVALWGFVFALGALCALRRRVAFPLAMAAFWFVGSWFNPLFSAYALWGGPIVAAVVLAWNMRFLKRRDFVVAGAFALVFCAAAAAIVVSLGTRWRSVDAPVPIRHVGNATYVNVRGGEVPETWVVDTTGEALGGILSAKGTRLFYAFNPKGESIAVVRSVSDLPREGVERLVLGGVEGDKWLKFVSTHPEAREHLPDAVVFVSPPFPPDAVPPALFDAANVVFIVGEFAARYGETYAAPRNGVVIVPGMETYIENWLGLSLGVPTE